MTIGEIMKRYRDEHSLTMRDFAKGAGISSGYVSMLENNRNPRTGKPVTPSLDVIVNIAEYMGMTVDELISVAEDQPVRLAPKHPGVKIKVYGQVAAGIPIEAIEDIIDEEEITPEMAKTGDFFGLIIKGDSMEPRIWNGDTVIIRKQQDAESGDIVIATVNGNTATCKKLIKRVKGIELISLNPRYDPLRFSNQQVIELPVTILGIVKEVRGKL